MSAISNFLTFLRSAIYAIDVRDGIADAIEQCYNDVNNPTLKTEALEAALQTKIDEGEMAALTIGDGTITAAKLASGVIDNTLATSGAAADAKKTGDELSALKADLDAQTGIISKKAGYYINLITDPVDISNPSPSSTGLTYAVVNCSEGDKFVVNAVGATSGRAWGFLDSSNHVLSMADANATVEDLELIAPTNAVKLIINDKSGGTSYKAGNNLVSRVSEIERSGSGLSNDAKQALLECFKHIGWENDTNGQDYYNTLEDALYPDAIYDIWEWDTRSSGRNKLFVHNGSDMPSGVYGIDCYDVPTQNTRRGLYIEKGKHPMVLHTDGTLTSYYPVPVPKDASKVTITVSPSSQQLAVYLYTYVGSAGNGELKYRTVPGRGPVSFETGQSIVEFEPARNQFLSFNMRRDASNTAYTTDSEPEVNILFE